MPEPSRNPFASIATPEERAWERLRLAIEAYLAKSSPANLAARKRASRDFVDACGE